MEELFQKNCKNCGGAFSGTDAADGVIKCRYCHSTFTIPKEGANPATLIFLRQGDHDLDTGRFDDAYIAYKKAAELDGSEPEAYFGMALAEFKVQYIKDLQNVNGVEIKRLQPICHEYTDKSFIGNKNYRLALELATQNQKEEYVKKAQEIEYIRSEFLKLKDSGLDYDCFICVKVSRTDSEEADYSKKNWTDDAYAADAIYDLLKRNGFTPFYSEREIRGRTGVDYEALILYALYTSETMLVVCRNEEYLKSPWVKNEFTRFKELVNNEEKENDALTIVYNGKPIERLPGSNRRIQGIDYSRREADFEIVKFVEAHTPIARARREEERRKKEEQSENLSRELDFIKRQVASATETVGSLLERANQELAFGKYDSAQLFFDRVLSADPRNVEAWWGLFLVDNKAKSEIEIIDNLTWEKANEIPDNRNYKMAVSYDAGKSNVKIARFQLELASPKTWWKIFLREMNVSDQAELLDAMDESNYRTFADGVYANKCYKKAKECADAKFKVFLEEFTAAINARAEEIIEQEKQDELEEKQFKKKLLRNKFIFTAIAVVCLITGYIVMMVSQGGIGYSGNSLFGTLLFMLVFFGGMIGMLAFLIYSLIVLWKCPELSKSIIFMVLLNAIVPFIWCGLLLLISLIG